MGKYKYTFRDSNNPMHTTTSRMDVENVLRAASLFASRKGLPEKDARTAAKKTMRVILDDQYGQSGRSAYAGSALRGLAERLATGNRSKRITRRSNTPKGISTDIFGGIIAKQRGYTSDFGSFYSDFGSGSVPKGTVSRKPTQATKKVAKLISRLK